MNIEILHLKPKEEAFYCDWKERIPGKGDWRQQCKLLTHMVDALASGAEEGRGKLRKASGSRKQALIRGYPNGETRLG
jgi:hypothetical protein